MKTWKSWILFVFVCFLLWQGAFCLAGNPLLFPSLGSVLSCMVSQICASGFVLTLFSTWLRIVFSVLLSVLIGFGLAVLSSLSAVVSSFLNKLCLVLRSIPNISFIILALFWAGREQAVIVVLVLLLFPVAYTSLYGEIVSINRRYAKVFQLFAQPLSVKIKKVWLPLLRPVFGSVFVNLITLGFKAGVTAEVLCQVQTGLGYSLQASRFNVDTAAVMAWTLWLVLLSFATVKLVARLEK